MFKDDTIEEFLVDMTKEIPKLLKTAPSDGVEFKWGISKGNEEDLYIDFSKNTTFSGIPICFDTFCQAINFCINSELFAGGFPNPVDLAPGEQYYDFSNIIAITAPIDNSVVLLDTGRFPEGKKIEDYVKGFKPGPDLDQEFSIVAEEDESITAPRVLDITEVSRTVHLKTKGLEKYGLKEISVGLSIPIMVSTAFLCYLVEQFITGALDQDTIALIGQVLLDPEKAPVDIEQVRCDDYGDTLFFDIWPNDEIYSIFDIFYDEDGSDMDDEEDDPAYDFREDSDKKYEM